MNTENFLSPGFKAVLKEALTEVLQEQRELLHDVVAEVVEEKALVEAVEKSRKTKPISNKAIFEALQRRGS